MLSRQVHARKDQYNVQSSEQDRESLPDGSSHPNLIYAIPVAVVIHSTAIVYFAYPGIFA